MEPEVSFKGLIHPHPDAPEPEPLPETPPEEEEVVEVKQERLPIPVMDISDETPPTCPSACPFAPPPPSELPTAAPLAIPPGDILMLVGSMYLLGAITGGVLAYSFSKPCCKA